MEVVRQRLVAAVVMVVTVAGGRGGQHARQQDGSVSYTRATH